MNTKNLDFKPLEKPIKLTGKFGFYIKDKEYHIQKIKQNNFIININKTTL